MSMSVKEAWDTLKYFAYKADAEEYANNCSEYDGDRYREAEATIDNLIKEANS